MKINVLKNRMVFIVLLLPFIKLPGMGEYASTDFLMDMMFAFSTVVLLYVAFRIKYRPNVVLKLAFLLQTYLFLVTIYYGSLTLTLLRNTIGVFIAMVLVDIWIRRNDFIVYDSMLILFVLYTLANVFLGYGRFFETYLFGQRTNLTSISVPMIFLSVYAAYVQYRRTGRPWYIAALGVIFFLNLYLIAREAVSTAMMAILLFPMLICLLRIRLLEKIKPVFYLLAFSVYNILFFTLQKFEMFRFIITGIFGESMTLTGRTLIWANAINGFVQRPLFGYGVKMLWVSRGEYSTSTAMVHNNLLQFLTEGGVTGLVLFLIMIAAAVRRLCIRRDRMEDILLLAALCSMFTSMITEVLTLYNYFYFMIVLIAVGKGNDTNEKQCANRAADDSSHH